MTCTRVSQGLPPSILCFQWNGANPHASDVNNRKADEAEAGNALSVSSTQRECTRIVEHAFQRNGPSTVSGARWGRDYKFKKSMSMDRIFTELLKHYSELIRLWLKVFSPVWLWRSELQRAVKTGDHLAARGIFVICRKIRVLRNIFGVRFKCCPHEQKVAFTYVATSRQTRFGWAQNE